MCSRLWQTPQYRKSRPKSFRKSSLPISTSKCGPLFIQPMFWDFTKSKSPKEAISFYHWAKFEQFACLWEGTSVVYFAIRIILISPKMHASHEKHIMHDSLYCVTSKQSSDLTPIMPPFIFDAKKPWRKQSSSSCTWRLLQERTEENTEQLLLCIREVYLK